MVGLLFAFMPVLAGSRGEDGDRLDVVRTLVRCGCRPRPHAGALSSARRCLRAQRRGPASP